MTQRLTIKDISAKRLLDFRALEKIPEDGRSALLDSASLRRLNPGEFLFRGRPPADVSFFLIQGEFEVQESASVRYKVYAGGEQARNALEDGLALGATLRAIDEVTVLVLPRAVIDEARSSPDLQAFTIEYSPASAPAPAPAPVPAKSAEDWMSRIAKAPLLADFSSNDVQRFFMELERVECREGEDIVSIGCRGDYFYILFEGTAQVLTDKNGPYAGAVFELQPGSHFGEEALIADTPRNATVRMKTNGAIGRLGRPQFDAIFRSALIQVVELDKAIAFLDSSKQHYELLDIRPEPEYAATHHEGARNLPIQSLRKEMSQLPLSTTFLVCAEGGRLSQLGVFLLRQSGRSAYLLNS